MLCRYCKAEGAAATLVPAADPSRLECPECEAVEQLPARQAYKVRVAGTWESEYEVHALNSRAAVEEGKRAAVELAGDSVDVLRIGRVDAVLWQFPMDPAA